MSVCPLSLHYSEVQQENFAVRLAELRANQPIAEITSERPEFNGFLITRRADIQQIAGDAALFNSSSNAQAARYGAFNNESAEIYNNAGCPIKPVLVWTDPPAHTKFRRVVNRIFSAVRVEERARHIQLCIDKAIDGFSEKNCIEAIGELALPVPAMVMTREFGAHEDEYPFLIEVTNEFGGPIDFTRHKADEEPLVVATAARAAVRFQRYMLPKIEHVSGNPDNTMLSELVNATENGVAALTTQEVQSLLLTFLIAATHSTTGGLGWVLYMLAIHQDVQARLRREPEKIDAFVEEVMRMHGTVTASYRNATQDTEINGTAFKSGANILLRWDSANFDEAFWKNPQDFDIDRTNVRAHFAFGSGVHVCVGNSLARKEMALTIQSMLARYSNIKLDDIAPPPRILPSTGIHILQNLPLRLVS